MATMRNLNFLFKSVHRHRNSCHGRRRKGTTIHGRYNCGISTLDLVTKQGRLQFCVHVQEKPSEQGFLTVPSP
ncbi:hypothetical protein CAOG_05521 [Capsaspora owczarzaki ATCC 30864]|uniref:hypothetical protein n=1 Tax=Capsaspora owczarzaki (strain ATCC 30864) TaxID=595528 RepID=UPI0001FE2727|nr:hypothetical protein CAOG_05521 [Capsaspora owczarzaki ATCC 30864]|eukprot:XP_004346194.1 hypothetical protein CAOG_05521 [Capsaspora owczarzaki ATCC 30864]